MTQTTGTNGNVSADYSQPAAPVINTGLSTLLECLIPVEARVLTVQVKPANNALTNFVISVKFSQQGAYQSIITAVTATPPLPVTAASGTLASLTAGSAGWLFMNVSGVYSVLIQAQCATGADTCDAYGFASP